MNKIFRHKYIQSVVVGGPLFVTKQKNKVIKFIKIKKKHPKLK